MLRHRVMGWTVTGAFLLSTSALGVGCGQLIGLDSYSVDVDDGTGGRSGDDPVPCEADEDCQENPCATGTCEDGECAFRAVTAGTECPDGVCNGSTSSPACVRCIDDVGGDGQDSGCPEGAPQCRIDGDAVCVGCASGSDCDDGSECNVDTCTEGECHYSGGCGSDAPICDAGTCIECTTNAHCDDNVDCSEDVCSDGQCVHDYRDDDCPQSGELCAIAECTASGCMVVDRGIATATELLVNGSLDEGTAWTYASSPTDWDVLTPPTVGSAQTGANIGHLVSGFVNQNPSDEGEIAYIYQDVDIPSGIDALRASGYYRVPTVDPSGNTAGDALDYVGVGFWNGSSWDERIDVTPSTGVVTEWTSFEVFFDLSVNQPGTTSEFNAIGEGDGESPHVSYYVDSLSLEAIVCND